MLRQQSSRISSSNDPANAAQGSLNRQMLPVILDKLQKRKKPNSVASMFRDTSGAFPDFALPASIAKQSFEEAGRDKYNSHDVCVLLQQLKGALTEYHQIATSENIQVPVAQSMMNMEDTTVRYHDTIVSLLWDVVCVDSAHIKFLFQHNLLNEDVSTDTQTKLPAKKMDSMAGILNLVTGRRRTFERFSLQQLVLEIIKLLIMHCSTLNKLFEIGSLLTVAFDAFPRPCYLGLLETINKHLLPRAEEMEGSTLTSTRTKSSPAVPIIKTEGEEMMEAPVAYQLELFYEKILPGLLKSVLQYLEPETEASSDAPELFHRDKLIDTIARNRIDFYSDLIELIAYGNEVERVRAVRMLWLLVPVSIGHLSTANIDQILPFKRFSKNTRKQSISPSFHPVATETIHNHRYFTHLFPNKADIVENRRGILGAIHQTTKCQVCHHFIEGCGLKCYGCSNQAIHIECLDSNATHSRREKSEDLSKTATAATEEKVLFYPIQHHVVSCSGHYFDLGNSLSLSVCAICYTPCWGANLQSLSCKKCKMICHWSCLSNAEKSNTMQTCSFSPDSLTKVEIPKDVLTKTFSKHYSEYLPGQGFLKKGKSRRENNASAESIEEIAIQLEILSVQETLLINGLRNRTIILTSVDKLPSEIDRSFIVSVLPTLTERVEYLSQQLSNALESRSISYKPQFMYNDEFISQLGILVKCPVYEAEVFAQSWQVHPIGGGTGSRSGSGQTVEPAKSSVYEDSARANANETKAFLSPNKGFLSYAANLYSLIKTQLNLSTETSARLLTQQLLNYGFLVRLDSRLLLEAPIQDSAVYSYVGSAKQSTSKQLFLINPIGNPIDNFYNGMILVDAVENSLLQSPNVVLHETMFIILSRYCCPSIWGELTAKFDVLTFDETIYRKTSREMNSKKPKKSKAKSDVHPENQAKYLYDRIVSIVIRWILKNMKNTNSRRLLEKYAIPFTRKCHNVDHGLYEDAVLACLVEGIEAQEEAEFVLMERIMGLKSSGVIIGNFLILLAVFLDKLSDNVSKRAPESSFDLAWPYLNQREVDLVHSVFAEEEVSLTSPKSTLSHGSGPKTKKRKNRLKFISPLILESAGSLRDKEVSSGVNSFDSSQNSVRSANEHVKIVLTEFKKTGNFSRVIHWLELIVSSGISVKPSFLKELLSLISSNDASISSYNRFLYVLYQLATRSIDYSGTVINDMLCMVCKQTEFQYNQWLQQCGMQFSSLNEDFILLVRWIFFLDLFSQGARCETVMKLPIRDLQCLLPVSSSGKLNIESLISTLISSMSRMNVQLKKSELDLRVEALKYLSGLTEDGAGTELLNKLKGVIIVNIWDMLVPAYDCDADVILSVLFRVLELDCNIIGHREFDSNLIAESHFHACLYQIFGDSSWEVRFKGLDNLFGIFSKIIQLREKYQTKIFLLGPAVSYMVSLLNDESEFVRIKCNVMFRSLDGSTLELVVDCWTDWFHQEQDLKRKNSILAKMCTLMDMFPALTVLDYDELVKIIDEPLKKTSDRSDESVLKQNACIENMKILALTLFFRMLSNGTEIKLKTLVDLKMIVPPLLGYSLSTKVGEFHVKLGQPNFRPSDPGESKFFLALCRLTKRVFDKFSIRIDKGEVNEIEVVEEQEISVDEVMQSFGLEKLFSTAPGNLAKKPEAEKSPDSFQTHDANTSGLNFFMDILIKAVDTSEQLRKLDTIVLQAWMDVVVIYVYKFNLDDKAVSSNVSILAELLAQIVVEEDTHDKIKQMGFLVFNVILQRSMSLTANSLPKIIEATCLVIENYRSFNSHPVLSISRKFLKSVFEKFADSGLFVLMMKNKSESPNYNTSFTGDSREGSSQHESETGPSRIESQTESDLFHMLLNVVSLHRHVSSIQTTQIQLIDLDKPVEDVAKRMLLFKSLTKDEICNIFTNLANYIDFIKPPLMNDSVFEDIAALLTKMTTQTYSWKRSKWDVSPILDLCSVLFKHFPRRMKLIVNATKTFASWCFSRCQVSVDSVRFFLTCFEQGSKKASKGAINDLQMLKHVLKEVRPLISQFRTRNFHSLPKILDYFVELAYNDESRAVFELLFVLDKDIFTCLSYFGDKTANAITSQSYVELLKSVSVMAVLLYRPESDLHEYLFIQKASEPRKSLLILFNLMVGCCGLEISYPNSAFSFMFYDALYCNMALVNSFLTDAVSLLFSENFIIPAQVMEAAKSIVLANQQSLLNMYPNNKLGTAARLDKDEQEFAVMTSVPTSANTNQPVKTFYSLPHVDLLVRIVNFLWGLSCLDYIYVQKDQPPESQTRKGSQDIKNTLKMHSRKVLGKLGSSKDLLHKATSKPGKVSQEQLWSGVWPFLLRRLQYEMQNDELKDTMGEAVLWELLLDLLIFQLRIGASISRIYAQVVMSLAERYQTELSRQPGATRKLFTVRLLLEEPPGAIPVKDVWEDLKTFTVTASNVTNN